MGVYLPNVDMPKGDKALTVQICPDGSIWQQYRGTVPNAKAVPVPKHGKLIDADVLKSNGFYTLICYTGKMPYEYTAMLIDDAPTIIPAEPAESEEEEMK